jgi:hypothetical protein
LTAIVALEGGVAIAGQLGLVFDDGEGYGFSAELIEQFRARSFGLIPGLEERVSASFVAAMLAYEERYGIGFSIARAVIDLERETNESGTKPASAFKRAPLLGLWHKHFFDARFLPRNYAAASSNKDRFARATIVLEETQGLDKEVQAREFVRRVWSDPVDERLKNMNATGEWIVFLPRDGKNYYLLVSAHRKSPEAQERLLRTILRTCSIDFPDLSKWLEEAVTA